MSRREREWAAKVADLEAENARLLDEIRQLEGLLNDTAHTLSRLTRPVDREVKLRRVIEQMRDALDGNPYSYTTIKEWNSNKAAALAAADEVLK